MTSAVHKDTTPQGHKVTSQHDGDMVTGDLVTNHFSAIS